MNMKLPPFKNGEHSSESASTIDHVITALTLQPAQSTAGGGRRVHLWTVGTHSVVQMGRTDSPWSYTQGDGFSHTLVQRKPTREC